MARARLDTLHQALIGVAVLLLLGVIGLAVARNNALKEAEQQALQREASLKADQVRMVAETEKKWRAESATREQQLLKLLFWSKTSDIATVLATYPGMPPETMDALTASLNQRLDVWKMDVRWRVIQVADANGVMIASTDKSSEKKPLSLPFPPDATKVDVITVTPRADGEYLLAAPVLTAAGRQATLLALVRPWEAEPPLLKPALVEPVAVPAVLPAAADAAAKPAAKPAP